MSKNQLKKLIRITNDILKSSRVFMLICNEKFGRGMLGELLTFRQLLNSFGNKLCEDINDIKYLGSSRKGVDIKLYFENKIFEINAKGTTEHDKLGNPRWVRQSARMFSDFKVVDKKIQITPRIDYQNNFFYIFVDVKLWMERGKANFFVLSDKEAKKILGRKYKRNFEGKPPRKNNSDDMWVEYKDIKNYKDNSLRKILRT